MINQDVELIKEKLNAQIVTISELKNENALSTSVDDLLKLNKRLNFLRKNSDYSAKKIRYKSIATKYVLSKSKNILKKEEEILKSIESLFNKIKEKNFTSKKILVTIHEISHIQRTIETVKRNINSTKEIILSINKNRLFYYLSIFILIKLLKKTKIKIKKKIKIFLTPKLGLLYHHSPKKIFIPNRYKKRIISSNLPVISIVTPSYNHGKFIERTIKSVINQKYPNLEYIIQDGHSTDGTSEILSRYESQLKYWESTKDDGQSDALNKGFCRSTGEIMAYLNSDDILLPGTLFYVGKYFARNPNVHVIYGHRVLIDENDKEIGRWVLPQHDSEILSWADYIPQETLFWRRRAWEVAGSMIDNTFHFAMDWDLILRFKDTGANFVRVPRFLGAFRIHPNQKTSNCISQAGLIEMKHLRNRCHGKDLTHKEISLGIRPYLRKHLFYHHLYYAGILRY